LPYLVVVLRLLLQHLLGANEKIYNTGIWRHTRRNELLSKAPAEMLSNEPDEYESVCVDQVFHKLDKVPFADDKNQLSF
jgi:hypothetical protein